MELYQFRWRSRWKIPEAWRSSALFPCLCVSSGSSRMLVIILIKQRHCEPRILPPLTTCAARRTYCHCCMCVLHRICLAVSWMALILRVWVVQLRIPAQRLRLATPDCFPPCSCIGLYPGQFQDSTLNTDYDGFVHGLQNSSFLFVYHSAVCASCLVIQNGQMGRVMLYC